MHVRSPKKALTLSQTRPVTLMVFDLLRLFGSDLTGQSWWARRELLERLDLDTARWQTPPTYDDGQELLDATADQGLEGVVSKRRASTYSPGRRSPDWVKVPHRTLVSAVVGGWRPETGSDSRLGAVLVGTPREDGRLDFSAGRPGLAAAGSPDSTLAPWPLTPPLPALPRGLPGRPLTAPRSSSMSASACPVTPAPSAELHWHPHRPHRRRRPGDL